MDSIPILVLRVPPQVEVIKIWGVPTMDAFEVNVLYLEMDVLKIKTIPGSFFTKTTDEDSDYKSRF